MPPPPQENKLKVSNPERILRILQKLCQASLQVTIKPPNSAGLSIRGKAQAITTDRTVTVMGINSISPKGLEHLPVGGKIQVEFVMMSTKVVFQTVILKTEQTGIIVQIPIALVSIERRKNARFPTSPEMLAFISLSTWRNEGNDLLAPPSFPQHEALSNLVMVADVSSNGLCASFQFPSLKVALKAGVTDMSAHLHLPMQEPVPIGIQIKWFKTINEGATEGEARQLRSYRFGAEFVDPSEELKLRLRHFIHQLTQQGAI